MRYFLVLIIPMALLAAGQSTLAEQSLASALPTDKTCVGYKTKKRMFLAADVDVVGTNCSISLNAAEPGEKVVVTIAVDKFDSGSTDRDEHVAQILGGADKKPIVFETLIPGQAQLSGPYFDTRGVIELNGASHKLDVTFVKVDKGVYTFQAPASMSQFGIVVPKVGWGLIATPSDELVLFGRVHTTQADQ